MIGEQPAIFTVLDPHSALLEIFKAVICNLIAVLQITSPVIYIPDQCVVSALSNKMQWIFFVTPMLFFFLLSQLKAHTVNTKVKVSRTTSRPIKCDQTTTVCMLAQSFMLSSKERIRPLDTSSVLKINQKCKYNDMCRLQSQKHHTWFHEGLFLLKVWLFMFPVCLTHTWHRHLY